MGGCNERYDDNRSEEQIRRDERREARKKNREKTEESFLLKIKQAHLSGTPLPNFLDDWARLPKGPAVSKKEFEELKQRVATHRTPIMSMDVKLMRRLLQTHESKLLKREKGIVKELPAVGTELIVASNGYDDFPGVVVAHLPQGTVLAYELGEPHGDGGTPGRMHVYSGSLTGLNIRRLSKAFRKKS